MDQNELMKLLNIKPKEMSYAKGGKDPTPRSSKGGPSDASETITSKFALDLDAFDQASGGKLLRHNHHLRETKLEPEVVSDLYSLNYLTCPQTVDKCIDERRLEFVSKTMETPEYKGLHRSTELNQVASELAAVELAESFAKLRAADEKQEKSKQERRARGKSVDEAKEALKSDINCIRAVSRGLKRAEKEVEEYEESMSALGCGGHGGRNEQMDVGRVVQMYKKIKDDDQLRRIMELAGRYRRCAQSKQRRKVIHGQDEFVGITVGGKIEHILPQELAMFSVPELELDAMRRLAENQMMMREHRGVERVGKGSIVVVVDESGSMAGEAVAQAKAFALSMAWIARHQHRWVALVGFAGGTEGTRLAMPPSKWDEAALLDWLAHFYSGGTSLDCPLKGLPEVYWKEFLAKGMKRGRTDIILITDAVVWLPPDIEASFKKWKQEEQVKCISIVINGVVGDLARVSDMYFEVSQLDLEQEAIQTCLAM